MSNRRQSFSHWLKQQIHRDDPVGDLARDIVRAGRTPTVASLFFYLFHEGARDFVHAAAHRATQEYHLSRLPPPPKVPAKKPKKRRKA